jgi:Flp pilus assembly pilin Flp
MGLDARNARKDKLRPTAFVGAGITALGAAADLIRRFVRTEEGVLTVEWVALAACMVVGAVVLSFMVMHSLSATAQSIGAQLTTP